MNMKIYNSSFDLQKDSLRPLSIYDVFIDVHKLPQAMHHSIFEGTEVFFVVRENKTPSSIHFSLLEFTYK